MLTEWHRTAEEAARHAGRIVREMLANSVEVRFKGPRDPVTDADYAAQDAILSLIGERFPDHAIMTEEDASLAPDERGVWAIPPGITWVIDPLDGTTNYSNGLPFFCVSIGVAQNGEPVVGAIYDPMRDELFSGARGLGATLNGTPLPPLSVTPLEHAVFALDWSAQLDVRARSFAVASEILSKCHTGRATGSAALAQVYVAARRVHIYFHLNLQPWDVAAAAAILYEVGGEIRKPNGSLWHLGEPSLVASHPSLLDSLLPLVTGTPL